MDSTLFRGYGLESTNLLLDPGAFALRAPEFCLLVFAHSHLQSEFPVALLTFEIIRRHGAPPVQKMISLWNLGIFSNDESDTIFNKVINAHFKALKCHGFCRSLRFSPAYSHVPTGVKT